MISALLNLIPSILHIEANDTSLVNWSIYFDLIRMTSEFNSFRHSLRSSEESLSMLMAISERFCTDSKSSLARYFSYFKYDNLTGSLLHFWISES